MGVFNVKKSRLRNSFGTLKRFRVQKRFQVFPCKMFAFKKFFKNFSFNRFGYKKRFEYFSCYTDPHLFSEPCFYSQEKRRIITFKSHPAGKTMERQDCGCVRFTVHNHIHPRRNRAISQTIDLKLS